MISVVYITNRGPYPLIEEPYRHLSQWDLLADSLKEQTYDDYELICVAHDEPRAELRWLCDRVRWTHQKATAWDELHAFQPSAARNTGLALARGDVVFSLDDCTTFGPGLLRLIADHARSGEYVCPNYYRGGVLWDRGHGGIIAYPRLEALAAGGWEERFAGCQGLEDWEFADRMKRRGVTFVKPDAARVDLQKHEGRQGTYLRCPHAVRELLKEQTIANRKWTSDELRIFTAKACPFAHGDQCQVRPPNRCAHQKRPALRVAEIMQRYER